MAKQVLVRKGFVTSVQQQGTPNLVTPTPIDATSLTPSLSSLISGMDVLQLFPELRDMIKFWTRADTVVGSAAQVSSNLANYSSISSALAALPSGGTILVLPGSYSGSITLSTANTNIIGMGNSTIVSGSITISASNCSVKFLRCTGGFSLSGNYNIVKEIWTPAAASITNTGSDNIYEIIKEAT